MPKRPAKLGNSFFGDSGTMLNENARDEIEQNAGAGHKGNDVDISQRYAQSEADEHTEQAERITRSLEKSNEFKYSGQFADPEKRREFVEGLAEGLRGKPAVPVKPQESEEEPSLSRAADDKFWNSEEPKKVMPRKL
jgi:hypothetical protein